MQQIRICIRICVTLCCLALFHAHAVQAAAENVSPLILSAPGTVVRGSALLATGSSSTPVEVFLFRWLGKEHRARAEQLADGSWQASILLPTPLEYREQGSRLVLCAVLPGQKGPSLPLADKSIRLTDKERPVQVLKVDRRYVEPPASVQERIRHDREKVRQALATIVEGRQWTLPLARPVPGSISSLFGLRRVFNNKPRGWHRGLDLRGAEGTPVQACADGQAVLCDNLYFAGNSVYLAHGEGVFTAYIHLSRILVVPGQQVKRGQVIGLVGATGRVTGPHLHLSLLVQGQAVDPEPLLAEQYLPSPIETQGRAE